MPKAEAVLPPEAAALDARLPGPALSLVTARAPRAEGAVRLHGLTKRYDSFCAVDQLSLEVESGEFVTVLGPSGSGKTTVLMMVAGLVEPSAGAISIGGRDITRLSPQHRNLGVVFQNYALFPHLTVAQNIAFPLRMRRCPEHEIQRKVCEMLELVRLPGVAQRNPSQLSGGQQQRVALARALVFDPPVLLLDEPLSALDKKLRESMQFEIRELHRKLGVTIINVTHDQSEALAMSDRVVIMRDGKVVQSGSPRQLYEQPASAFVADFLGASNFIEGTLQDVRGSDAVLCTDGGLRCRVPRLSGLENGQRARMMMRPERIVLGEGRSRDEAFPGRIAELAYTGEIIRYRITLSKNDIIEVSLQNREGSQAVLEIGSPVTVGWRLADVHVFPGNA